MHINSLISRTKNDSIDLLILDTSLDACNLTYNKIEFNLY